MRKTTIKALAIIAITLWAGMFGTPFLYGEANFDWNKRIGFDEQAWTVTVIKWMPTAPFMSYGQERPEPPENFDDWNGVGLLRPSEIFWIYNGEFKRIRKNIRISQYNLSGYKKESLLSEFELRHLKRMLEAK